MYSQEYNFIENISCRQHICLYNSLSISKKYLDLELSPLLKGRSIHIGLRRKSHKHNVFELVVQVPNNVILFECKPVFIRKQNKVDKYRANGYLRVFT